MTAAEEVEAAAVALIDAFAANDRRHYFAAFAPEATFVFPIVNRVLVSRDDYEAEWQRWIDNSDFKVRECQSLDRQIQVYGDMAVFIHRTVTHSSSTEGDLTLHERETIVFRKVKRHYAASHLI